MFPCKYHQNGGFSMAMLVLGRVYCFFLEKGKLKNGRRMIRMYPETIILHLKIDGWFRWHILFGITYFQGQTCCYILLYADQLHLDPQFKIDPLFVKRSGNSPVWGRWNSIDWPPRFFQLRILSGVSGVFCRVSANGWKMKSILFRFIAWF